MKKKLFILPVLSLALFATACSGNTNKELLETYEQSNDTTTETTEADLKAFAPTTSSSDYDITCDFSGYADGAIYTVSPKEFTPSYLTELADKIFDKNFWSVCTPFEVASLNEFKKELEIIDNTAETLNKTIAESYFEDYDYGTSSMDCGNILVAINAVDGTEIYANDYPPFITRKGRNPPYTLIPYVNAAVSNIRSRVPREHGILQPHNTSGFITLY